MWLVNKPVMIAQGYKYPHTKFTDMYFQLGGKDLFEYGCIVSSDAFYRDHGEKIMEGKMFPNILGDDNKAGTGG